MSEIKKTSDYSIFKKHESNRKIDELNLKKILNSISAKNLLELRPILVDKNMRIIDGQHRLEAAKILCVEVFYQVDPASNLENMILLNANQKRWTTDDYLNFYAEQGKEEYIKFLEFSRRTGINSSDILKSYASIRREDLYNTVKRGTLKFLSEENQNALISSKEKLEEVLDIISSKFVKKQWYLKSKKLKSGLSMILNRSDLDFEKFKKNLLSKIDCLHACVDMGSYYGMFKDIYNFRNPDPLE